MARKTQLDRMVEKLDAEIAALQAARARVVAERDAAAARRHPKPAADPVAHQSV